MLRKNRIRSSVFALVCSISAFAVGPIAEAGTGGSPGVIRSAIRTNNADAIIAALEQSENIPCNSNCMAMVMDLLDNDDYRIREVAAWWFARRPAQMREVADQAIAWLSLGTSVEARNGADALGTFGYAKYISVLQTAARKEGLNASARAAIVKALGSIGNTVANETVATAMSDADPQVRLQAVLAWKGMLKQNNAEPVVALIGDSSVAVRRSALATLGQFRVTSARTALEATVLQDTDAAVRRNAAWALGRIGSAQSTEALRAASTDASSLVRMTAKVALTKLR